MGTAAVVVVVEGLERSRWRCLSAARRQPGRSPLSLSYPARNPPAARGAGILACGRLRGPDGEGNACLSCRLEGRYYVASRDPRFPSAPMHRAGHRSPPCNAPRPLNHETLRFSTCILPVHNVSGPPRGMKAARSVTSHRSGVCLVVHARSMIPAAKQEGESSPPYAADTSRRSVFRRRLRRLYASQPPAGCIRSLPTCAGSGETIPGIDVPSRVAGTVTDDRGEVDRPHLYHHI